MNIKTSIVSALILIIFIVISQLVSQRKLPKVVMNDLDRIPLRILNYTGVDDFFSKEVNKELNTDKYIYRHYTDSTGKQIDFYIGYYGTAKGGRTPHNPYACLPSQGWAIIGSSKIFIKQKHTSDGVFLNSVISKNRSLTRYMLHWYQSAGTKVLDNGFKRNIHRLVGKVIYNRNDGAYVQLSMIKTDSSVNQIPEELIIFAQKILKILPKHWPEEL